MSIPVGRWWSGLLIIGPLLFSTMAAAEGTAESAESGTAYQNEELLIRALDALGDENLGEALQDIRSLVRKQPDFKLAQLIYADLLRAHSAPLKDFGDSPSAALDKVLGLREEARARLHYRHSPARDGYLPQSLMTLSDDIETIVVVDLSRARLFLFENHQGLPKLVDNFYVSSGKLGAGKNREGDKRTPIGVYSIVSFLEPDKLPRFYGAGAFPLDYPNEWDRRLGKTGSGIWLHGTSTDTYSRPPLASDGCVTLSNEDLISIKNRLVPGHTRVIVADGINWLALQDWKQQRQEFQAQLESWRQDWQSRDSERYLRHYSRSFKGPSGDYAAWVRHKKRVNASKQWIDVSLSRTDIFRYPGEQGLIVVDFEQDYRSSNYKSVSSKRQYWQREADGVWRIVYEGPG